MKPVLKWTAVLFAVTIVWMYFEKWMGWHSVNIQDHYLYTNIYDALFVLVISLSLWEWRKNTPDQELKWKRAHARKSELPGCPGRKNAAAGLPRKSLTICQLWPPICGTLRGF